MLVLMLVAFIVAVFVIWYVYNRQKFINNYVSRKEEDQRFPKKDKHLKIWRDKDVKY
jgi:hypothetical protein